MNPGTRENESETLFRVACEVLSTQRPCDTDSSDRGEDALLRQEIIGLEVLLACRAPDLFPFSSDGQEPHAAAEPPQRHPRQIGGGHYALALAASLVMAVLLFWAAAHPVGIPAGSSWRSARAGDLSVDVRAAAGELRLEWNDVDRTHWYRVSVVGVSGATLARRDLDRGCPCDVRVHLPDGEASFYWLVEAFDDRWSRVAVASGRVDAGAR